MRDNGVELNAHKPTSSDQAGAAPILWIVAAGTLLSALSSSAVNLALPDIGREFGASLENTRWIVQGYLLAVGILLLAAGRLSDMLGHGRVYLGGFLLLGLASLACGLSDGLTQLVALRIAQGISGALIMSAGPALVTSAIRPGARGRSLGLLSTATYVGLTIGPTLGGSMVSTLGWRWIFLLNAPVCLGISLFGCRHLMRLAGGRRAPFDLPGFVLLMAGLPALLLGLSKAASWGLLSGRTLGLVLGGGMVLVLFARFQHGRDNPLLDLDLFRSRLFTGSVLSALGNYVALFCVLLLLPFYLVEGQGRSPAQAGLILSMQPLLMAAIASPAGWLSDRIGTRILTVAGMLTLSAGLFALSRLGPDAGAGSIMVRLGMIGLGTGIFISPNSSALMGSAPRGRQGTAGALLAEARVLGMLLGVVLGTAVFESAGGRTGRPWLPEDFGAMSMALRTAAAVSLLGALAAGLKGESEEAKGTDSRRLKEAGRE